MCSPVSSTPHSGHRLSGFFVDAVEPAELQASVGVPGVGGQGPMPPCRAIDSVPSFDPVPLSEIVGRAAPYKYWDSG